ncbi:hypothetical protein GQ53DRAFT_755501 [Thozetella sp. PMI_491]|nr:hypothetical protein GQ53DRAFT_755501 [Thozetella sp. PMI_491]
MAQAHENLQEKLGALVVGSFMVFLDPTSPLGYCRMFKALRAMERTWRTNRFHQAESRDHVFYQLGIMDQPELGDLLPSIARAGSLIVQTHGNPSGPKYSLLANIVSKTEARYTRRGDLILALPFELRVFIFDYLDVSSRMKCKAVNSTWRDMLDDQAFWRNVSLNRPMVSTVKFHQFLKRHHGMRELAIRDTSHLSFDGALFGRMFRYLPSLESLSLGCPYDMRKLRPSSVVLHSSLKRLSFENPGDGNLNIVSMVARSAKATLEELTIIGPLHMGEEIFRPSQPNEAPWKLTSLRLDFTKPGTGRRARQLIDSRHRSMTSLVDLVLATPKLEQLYLDGFILHGDAGIGANQRGPPPIEFQRGWNRLRVLVLGEYVEGLRSPLRFYLPSLNPEIRVLDLITTCPNITHHLLFNMPPTQGVECPPVDWHTGAVHLPKLQVFRSRVRIHHNAWLESIVHPSIEAGTLRTLDLCLTLGTEAVYFMTAQDRNDAELNGKAALPIPVNDLPFTFSDKITTLGLSNFSWNDSGDYYSTLDPRPFLDYLDHFPAVHTIRVYPGQQANTLGLIQGIMRHKNKVRQIFQDGLELRDWYPAKEEADKRGVKLHHQYKGHAPPMFPYVATWPKPGDEPEKEQGGDT